MKFQLAINLERMDDSADMDVVAAHTLEMVQMAEAGGFTIVWAAEHHALEMTIAPNPFQILPWWAASGSERQSRLPPIGIRSTLPARQRSST